MDRNRLILFVKNAWHNDMALTAPQAGVIFGVGRGNSRYYLDQLVGEGILIRMQHEHNVWYLLAMHAKSFEQYARIGVTIKCRSSNKIVNATEPVFLNNHMRDAYEDDQSIL